ncbi:MAG: hypothetical protein LBJ74_05890 [Heliobacteriaceae bacterium]|jgi:predicted PurR-regulated permease PerM|nr:hypothetical protein [Heliobacteriaceae bacterium]
MDISQVNMNNGLTFLFYATGGIIIVVGVFLGKLLFDLSALAKNVNTTSAILNTELKPTLKELSETLKSVNAIVKNTDQGVDHFKTAVEKTFGRTKAISESIFCGLIKGFTTAFNLFRK